MTRDEFKKALADFVDELVPEDRELSDSDEDSLVEQLGEVASDILNSEEITSDEAEEAGQ